AYMRSVSLGFETDELVVVFPNTVFGEEWNALKQQLLARPEIQEVTGSYLVPFGRSPEMTAVQVDGLGQRDYRAQFLPVDYRFFETYGIDLLAGRTFSEDFGMDRLVRGPEGP